MNELYRKHRPDSLEGVFGQDIAVGILTDKIESHTLPHAILLHGPYGTGKTTLARIISTSLSCSTIDFHEKNTADYRGIDSIREIRDTVQLRPIKGNSRVWVLDEVHKATNDAQNAMLKLLEDPPNHAYFILCTTEPERLLAGIRQRCLEIKLQPLPEAALSSLIKKVCKAEGFDLKKRVRKKLVEYSGGSARQALQLLDKIHKMKEEEQFSTIEKASLKTATIEIARRLLNTKTNWRAICPLLNELKGEDPEQIRWMVMGYAQAILLKSDNPRAFRMLEAFRDHFYDCKFAGVVAACYEIIQG